MGAEFTIFSLIILLFSVVIHEISHGYAALCLGDRTAEYEGRLTLNPIKHIDPVGTIVLPAISLMLGGFLFGWAKPVPYNPYNLRDQRWGEMIVAAAGPVSNIVLALVFGLFIRFYLIPFGYIDHPIALISQVIVIVNITLAIFNLVPIPPLDGSKILSAVLPRSFAHTRHMVEGWGFFGIIIFLLFFWKFFSPIIPWLFGIITGIAF